VTSEFEGLANDLGYEDVEAMRDRLIGNQYRDEE
jgi:hypothetical protein